MFKQLQYILQSKVAKNGMWLIILQGFNTIIPLITIPYITRVMTKSAYGEFSLALNWIGYFQTIVEFGYGLSGARKVATANKNSDLSKVRSNIFFGRLLLLFICVVLFVILIIILTIPKTQIVCMILLSLMVIAIVFQQTWFFQGISEMKVIAIINVVGRLISLVLIFVFVKGANDLNLYCLLYATNILVVNLVGFIIVEKKYNIKLKKAKFKDIFSEIKEVCPLFISAAMTKIFAAVGVTVLGFLSTNEIVGAYSAINKIPYIFTLFFSAISQALYPQSCKNFNVSFRKGLEGIKKYATFVLFIFGVGCITLAVFHKGIVQIVFGSEYIEYSSLLIPFAIWVIAGIINNFLGIQILVASGHQKEYSKDFSLSVIFMIITMLIMGKFWNAYGIAIASMCSELFLSCLLIKDIQRCK